MQKSLIRRELLAHYVQRLKSPASSPTGRCPSDKDFLRCERCALPEFEAMRKCPVYALFSDSFELKMVVCLHAASSLLWHALLVLHRRILWGLIAVNVNMLFVSDGKVL